MSFDIIKSVSGDTKNGAVDLPRLTAEITNSEQFATVLESRAVDGDTLTLTFAAEPPQDEKDYLVVLLAAHNGEPLQPEDAMPVKLQPSEHPDTHIQIFGAHAFEADLRENGETEKDTLSYYLFPEATELQGVSADVENHNFGDSVTVALQAPTGLEAPAPEWVTVATFAVGAYVPHKGRMDVTSEGSSAVPAGMRIAVIYHATGQEGSSVRPRLIMNYRKWVS